MGRKGSSLGTSEANECIGSWFLFESEIMAKCHDLIRQIIDTATAIAERAAAIPVGDDPPSSLETEVAFALRMLKEIETDLDNLTEDDTR